MPDSSSPAHQDSSLRETIQSLIVAFVMAMAFRGFVLEGFEIPTGSMGPTLMGRHLRIHSKATDYEYPADAQPLMELANRISMRQARDMPRPVIDPMINQSMPIVAESALALASQIRLGDRVLVLKYLWPITSPQRWDVVVFRNPTDPIGDSLYYIKRLVGMPSESFAFADGDVFTGALGASPSQMTVQRKPLYVQNAVWQSVYDSDFQPIEVTRLEEATRRPWEGAPWKGADWDMRGKRVWSHDSSATTHLVWDNSIIPIDDFCSYNIYRADSVLFPVSDLRVAASVEANEPSELRTSLELQARSRKFSFTIGDGQLRLAIAQQETNVLEQEVEVALTLPGDGPVSLEFWHVDQRLSAWVNGREVAALEYDLGGPGARIQAAHYGRTLEQYLANPVTQRPTPPQLDWSFSGTPVRLRHVRVDRDLYYRPAFLNPSPQEQFVGNGAPLTGLAFGMNVTDPAQLDQRDHVMCGDNSGASRDSRLWGRPHLLLKDELNFEKPFLVPSELIIGKAWSVYFPAPLPIWPGGATIIPDFGRLRFIR
ncbi:MAG: S26 family signal peptidase [Phycisphaerales bacterium]|nr:S26 family signal peptidase [Phycisphaerales bacterium]